MALSWRMEREITDALINIANNHIGESVNIKEIRALLNAYADVSTQALTALVKGCDRFECVGKVKNLNSYKINVGCFFVKNVRKDKNILILVDDSNEAEKTLKFDFNTHTLEQTEYRIKSWGYQYDDLVTILTNRPNNLKEWIFNYPSLLHSGSFTIDFDCPKGYVAWLRENARRIDDNSLKDFNDSIKYAGHDVKVVEIAKRADEKSNITITSDDVLKAEKGILYAYEHEYLEDYFSREERWGNSSNNEIHDFIIKYLAYCKALNEEPIWKNVLKNYTIAKRMASLKIHEAEKEKVAKHQNKLNMAYENDDLVVIIPTTFEAFKAEANYQQNCVCAYYYPKVVNGITHVVFIRKKSDLNTPYITCEINNNGKIAQYLTRFNNSVRDEVGKNFRVEYEAFLKENN